MLQRLFRMVALVPKVASASDASSSALASNGMAQVPHEVLVDRSFESAFLTS